MEIGDQAVFERYARPIRTKPLVAVLILTLLGIELIGVIGNLMKSALKKV